MEEMREREVASGVRGIDSTFDAIDFRKLVESD